jgi:hypothetical protein
MRERGTSPDMTHRQGPSGRWRAPALYLSLALFVLVPAVAFAAGASAGEPLFYPCTSCHPVTAKNISKLPNHFDGHPIVLVGHDKLGKGSEACLACHDDAARNPGKLKLADGSMIDITGDVSLVCYRCHEAKYKEWKARVHGLRNLNLTGPLPKCTTAGCHDPHAPQTIFVSSLLPFMGSGFQAKVLPEKGSFYGFPSPGPIPPPETPWWLNVMTVVGLLVAAGLGVALALERLNR